MRTGQWRWVAGAALLLAAAALFLAFGSGGRPGVPEPGGGASVPQVFPPAPAAPDSASPPVPASAAAPPATAAASAAGFPPALSGQDLTVLPTTDRMVALTFDAGANAAGVGKILAALADAQVPATFFLTGAWAEANPAAVVAIQAAGHRVGNHSMTHPDFTGLSGEALAGQVLGAQRAIEAAGADPRPFFRFPFGARDARTIASVNELGYVAVRWTVDTLGWKGTSGGMSAAQVADRVLAGLRPGEIVLMHVGSHPGDGSTLDADALPGIIARIRSAGYGFTGLDTLLAPR